MALQSIDTGGEFLPVGLLDSPSGSPQEGGAGPFARDAMALPQAMDNPFPLVFEGELLPP